MSLSNNKINDFFALLSFFSLPDNPRYGILWFDSSGNITSNVNDVVRKEQIEIPQSKCAEDAKDFQTIFDKKMKEKFEYISIDAKISYIPSLIKEVKYLIQLHEESAPIASWNEQLKLIANKFIEWLIQARDLYINHNGISSIDPLRLIDINLLDLFLEAEKKATNGTLVFDSDTRCAAFCEMLYSRKYIINIDRLKLQTIIAFAIGRYKREKNRIKNALLTSRREGREHHKNRNVKNMIPLKNCF